jgi:hypothetical protein
MPGSAPWRWRRKDLFSRKGKPMNNLGVEP